MGKNQNAETGPLPARCAMHEEHLTKMAGQVEEIHKALMGTMSEPTTGLLIRMTAQEAWQADMVKWRLETVQPKLTALDLSKAKLAGLLMAVSGAGALAWLFLGELVKTAYEHFFGKHP